MTMEDRLNAISIDQSPGTTGTSPPKADALALLLTQGLQSQDKLIVNVSCQRVIVTILDIMKLKWLMTQIDHLS